jgi:predicted Zn-dependent peptidase
VCGNVQEEEVTALLGNMNLGTNDGVKIDLGYLTDIKESKNVYPSKFFQSAVSLTYQWDINYKHELNYASKIFLEMLNYDLFNIIREKYNYCYYIYAFSNSYLNTVEIVSEIESKNLDDIIRLISEILQNYIDNFNEEQFEISKKKIFTYINNAKDIETDSGYAYI